MHYFSLCLSVESPLTLRDLTLLSVVSFWLKTSWLTDYSPEHTACVNPVGVAFLLTLHEEKMTVLGVNVTSSMVCVTIVLLWLLCSISVSSYLMMISLKQLTEENRWGGSRYLPFFLNLWIFNCFLKVALKTELLMLLEICRHSWTLEDLENVQVKLTFFYSFFIFTF